MASYIISVASSWFPAILSSFSWSPLHYSHFECKLVYSHCRKTKWRLTKLNIVHVQKTYVHKPCIFCGHIWKGATYSIWEVHFNLFVIESHYTLVHRVESVENYALCMRWCLLWRRMLARILDVSMWTVTSNCATKFTLASCTLHDIIK